MRNLIDLLKQPAEDYEDNGSGGLHIPIDKLEDKLDDFQFSTANFKWQIYVNHDGEQCVAASIELHLHFKDDDRVDEYERPVVFKRMFVGTCNFSFTSLQGIPDWLSTAKSMCVKNAASDAGRYLGRGLNEERNPAVPRTQKTRNAAKMIPDVEIRMEYANAVAKMDKKTVDELESIYDFTRN